jgi:hypothetical protein
MGLHLPMTGEANRDRTLRLSVSVDLLGCPFPTEQWPVPKQHSGALLWTPPATSLTPSTKLTKKS